MRTPLFLSTLFAVSLIGGAALADKPQHTIENLRAHGDMVDKSYSSASRPAMAHESMHVSTREAAPGRTSRPAIDRSASRVNCSESGAECGARGGDGGAHAAMAETASGASGRVGRAPAFLDKILGSDRTNFNEADMDSGMSIRAANRAWAHAGHGAGHAAATAPASLAQQTAIDRKENQASTNREVCNEADACMASSKKSTKEWAYRAVKAGTWRGPDDKQPAHAAASAGKSDPAPEAAGAASAAATSKAHEHQD